MSVTVREARLRDAAALVAHLRRLVAEPGINIPLAPDELTLTVEDERARLEDLAASPRSVLFVADADGQLAGELSLRPVAPRRALQHVAVLGMSVDAAWRGRGIGSTLLTEAVAWAPRTGFTRIELNVYVRNAAAIRLYERFGFEREGRRRRFIREGDTYLDDLVMARLF